MPREQGEWRETVEWEDPEGQCLAAAGVDRDRACGAKTKDTWLAAQYRRIAARRGKKRALVALGHTILVMIYHILTRRQPYHELGVAYFDQLERQRVEQRLVRRLERLGYMVALQPSADPPKLAA